MTDTVTVVGLIATQIKHTVTSEGLEVASFRLASNSRRFDRTAQAWVDGETNWFSVVAFRQLAANLAASLDKGHRVVVNGRLRVREWRDGDKSGREVEIVADALGPDLVWGRASYTRTPRQAPVEAAPPAPEHEAAELDAAGFPAEAQEPVPTPF